MGKRSQKWFDFLLSNSPAQMAFHHGTERALVALAYHDILDEPSFRRQMAYVSERFNVVSADLVCAAIRGEAELPRRSLLITFDDGDRTVYEVGFPILREFGLPGIVFVVAGLIDSNEPFWWTEVEGLVKQGAAVPGVGIDSPRQMVRWIKEVPDAERLQVIRTLRASASEPVRTPQLTRAELREMQLAGLEVGNHTFTHPCLNRCDEATVVREIADGHAVLTDMLGHPPRLFAYPGGDRHPVVPRVLRDSGYEAAFLFDHRMTRFPPQDPFEISRVRVNSTTSMDRFRTILSGLHPFIHRIRGRR